VELALGLGLDRFGGDVERLDVLDERARKHALRAQVGAGRAQECESPARPAHQLDRLHRHQAEREVRAREAKVARIAPDRADGQSDSALGERGEQHGVALQGGELMAIARELQAHAPRARADLENRGPARDVVGDLAPEREIHAVQTALEVVPDHLRRAHHALLASPRATSSSRSASIAV